MAIPDVATRMPRYGNLQRHNCPSQSRRFFQVWLPFGLPRLADHPGGPGTLIGCLEAACSAAICAAIAAGGVPAANAFIFCAGVAVWLALSLQPDAATNASVKSAVAPTAKVIRFLFINITSHRAESIEIISINE